MNNNNIKVASDSFCKKIDSDFFQADMAYSISNFQDLDEDQLS